MTTEYYTVRGRIGVVPGYIDRVLLVRLRTNHPPASESKLLNLKQAGRPLLFVITGSVWGVGLFLYPIFRWVLPMRRIKECRIFADGR